MSSVGSDLEEYGFIERECAGEYGEQRLELRLKTDNSFVAWFQMRKRTSDGEQVQGANIQVVHRRDLRPDQIDVATEWLRRHVFVNF